MTGPAGADRRRTLALLAAGVLSMLLLAGLLSVQVTAWWPSPPAWRTLAGTLLVATPWWLAMALLAVLVAVRDPVRERGMERPAGDAGTVPDESGAGRGPDWQPLAARILATALITLLHGVAAALVLAWPLQAALATPSLGTYLMTATASLVIVLAPLSLWPAPFLPALARHADGVAGWRPALRLRRAVLAARALTGEAGAGMDRGLGVLWLYSACLLVPVLAVHAGRLRGWPLCALLLPAALIAAVLFHWLHTRLHASLDAAALLTTSTAVAEAGDAVPLAQDDATAAAIQSGTARQRAVRLREAVRDGQVEQALALLAAGADATEPPWPDDADQRDAVIIAASLTDSRPLRAMIAAGVDVNHRCQGITPLLAATGNAYYVGRVEIVLTLLANGARLDVRDAQGSTPLHHAALCADMAVAVMLIEAGAVIDALDADGHTPLARAALAGNAGMADLLLRHRAALQPAGGVPVLCAAAAATDDDPACVARLLAARADTAARDQDGRTPLHHAVAAGHLAITRCLLAAGADIHAGDDQGRSPLHLACARFDADNPIVHELRRAGADPDRADADGITPAMLSRARRQDEAGAATVGAAGGTPGAADTPVPAEDLDLPAMPAPERAALALSAAARGDLPLLRRALALPLPAAVRLPDGTDLVDAALAGWPATRPVLAALPACGVSLAGGGRLAQLLQAMRAAPAPVHADAEGLALAWLAAGADPFAVCAQANGSGPDGAGGSGPADQDRGQSAGLAGPDPDAVAARSGHSPPGPGSRPLHLAAALGFARLAGTLLEVGVDADQADHGGRTALHWLMILARQAGADGPGRDDARPVADAPSGTGDNGGRIESLVRLLLRHGADPDAACVCGETPLGLALDGGLAGLVPWLHWSGWRLPGRRLAGHDLVAAARAGDSQAVLRLLALGLPIQARDHSGGTALLQAAGHGHQDVVRLLLARGAQVDAAADSGNTPLVAAILGDHPDIVALLLAHGAVAERRLAHGATALLVAAACGALAACQQLLAAGADIASADDAGNRALHAAASHALGSADGDRVRQLLRTLLAAGADIDARNRQGLTALHVACGAAATSRPDERGIDAALDILLARAGAVQALDEAGRSALHYAAAHGQLQATRRLVARGADVALADSQGWSPVDLAGHYGHTEVLQLLRTSSAPPNLLLRPG